MSATHKELRSRLFFLVLLGVVAVLLCLSVVFAIIQTAPAEPLVISDAEMETDTACPLEPVTVITERELKRGYDVERISYLSTWEGRGTQLASYPAGEFIERDPNPYGKQRLVSPRVRQAPPQAGKWHLQTHVEVIFHYWGVPRVSTLE